MPELAQSGLITGGPGTPGTDLTLTEANGYTIVEDGFGPGARTWRRITAESPFVSGRTLVHAVRDTQQAAIGVRVVGSTASQLASRVAALITAFEQITYLLEITVGGVLYRWRCEPADSGPASGTFTNDLLTNHQQVWSFTIPRSPIPLAGPV